jgi:hypothetical protein
MRPVLAQWDGESFLTAKRHRALCDKQFAVGEWYTVVTQEERSAVSHKHYFAALHEAWTNLPEEIASRFVDEDHLRKHALIRSGFYHERAHACATAEEAERFRAFLEPIDDYAIVTVDGTTVHHYTAKSQSVAAMGKADFQLSKQAVLDWVAGLIDVTTGELHAAAGQAA